MHTIAFATCREWPVITQDDQLAADILRSHNIDVQAQVWDAPDVDWSKFDCVVIRSVWDYHVKPDQYATWLRSFASIGVQLWNPTEAVLANMNKKYLCSLAERGIDIVPTTYLEAAEGLNLRSVLIQSGLETVVIKPAVSAAAHGAWRTSLATADEDQNKFDEQVRGADILIQPYMPEIAAQGEWSLIFFDGAYSHAVLKRPATGDFRVQKHLGGETFSAEPSSNIVEQARRIVSQINHPLLYARVDGIERDGKFLLMELEINEPFLFLQYASDAPRRFAEAILSRLK